MNETGTPLTLQIFFTRSEARGSLFQHKTKKGHECLSTIDSPFCTRNLNFSLYIIFKKLENKKAKQIRKKKLKKTEIWKRPKKPYRSGELCLDFKSKSRSFSKF